MSVSKIYGVSVTDSSGKVYGAVRKKIYGQTVVSASSPGWQNNVAEGSINSTMNVDSYAYSRVTYLDLTAGTVSKLRFKITAWNAGFDVDAKICLYAPGGAIVVSATTTVNAAGVYEPSVTPTAISSGTYKVAVAGFANSDGIVYGVLSGQSSGSSYTNFSVGFSDLPGSSAPASESPLSLKIWVGAYVTP